MTAPDVLLRASNVQKYFPVGRRMLGRGSGIGSSGLRVRAVDDVSIEVRAGETLGWVSRNRQMNPGVAGTASGFEGLKQGAGLDVVPSLSVRERCSHHDQSPTLLPSEALVCQLLKVWRVLYRSLGCEE